MKFLIYTMVLVTCTAISVREASAKGMVSQNPLMISENPGLGPVIMFGKDNCTKCNMYVSKKIFAAALVKDNKTLPFCDIGDLVSYYHEKGLKSYEIWVYDFNSEKLLKAENAFFLVTKKIRTPMGSGIIAFEKEEDAAEQKAKTAGELARGFGELSEVLKKKGSKQSEIHHGQNLIGKKNHDDKNCNCGKCESCMEKHKKGTDRAGHMHHSSGDHHSHSHQFGFRGQPIGIMGAHTHHRDSFMMSYQAMYMTMQNNLSGASIVNSEQILKDYMFVPEKMNMFMHMAGAMYSLTDNLTIMAMVPFLSKSMTAIGQQAVHNPEMPHSVMAAGHENSMSMHGFGDVRLDALYNIFQNEYHSVILRGGVSLPSGNINIKGDMHGGENQQLPYPMQAGSGTYDLLTGLTYTSGLGEWTWGGQVNGNFRLGNNPNGYTLGNTYNFTAWAGKMILPEVHSFLRVNLDNWGNITGKDSAINEKMSPAARSDLRAGTKLDLLAGFNFILPDFLGRNSLGIEFGVPVYQNLTGPQLSSGWYVNSGVQHLF